MMGIRAVIIDDEQDARENISSMLGMYISDIELAGHANDVKSGYELICREKPELVFLDIKMPGGGGFALLRKFDRLDFRVIFITAYEHYAVQAFRFCALDYLLKPVDPDALAQTVKNAREALERENMVLKLRALEENLQSGGKPSKIVLKTAESIYLKNAEDIICLNSDGSYSEVILLDRSRIVVSKSLKDMETLLKDFGFLRIHKSHLINIAHLDRFVKGEGGYVLMKNNVQLPVSQRKREYLLKKLEDL